jgi:hypothetical protein
MSKIVQLQKEFTPMLRAGDLAECERGLSTRLAALPPSPFHIILDLSITTEPDLAATWFDDFFRKQGARFQIRAAYTEMNGFNINPDLWFLNAFAYEKYGGSENHDWLALWQSEDSECIAIEGLEPLQKIYASDAFRDQRFSDACDVTDFLVVVKFQKFIQEASRHMRELRFPLLSTAHEFDFIHEIKPGA